MNNPLEIIIEHLKLKEEYQVAEMLLDIFKKDSSTLEQLDLLGKLYYETKCYKKAIEVTEKALEKTKTEQEKYSVRCNMIKMKNHINEPADALKYIEENNKVISYSLDMEMEKVFSYFLLNQKDKSEQILRDLLLDHITEMDDATISRIKFNLGTYDLYHGRFQKGLRGFLLEGKKIGLWGQHKIHESKLVSDDNPLQQGDKLLILAEGGIGDELINIRFMKQLRDKGIDATWRTHREDLVKMFQRNGFNAVLEANFNDYNKICYSMSLPIWLNVKVEELWEEPYISPIKKDLFSSNKMKIGLRWSGNPLYEHDLHRSIEFEEVYKIVKEKYPDSEVYSLQYPRDNILDNYPEVIDCVPMIKDYEDTISIMDNLDLVITSCTSIAHASASIGKKTFVFVPISEYYTWCSPDIRGENKSIWYNENLTLFRQEIIKSWKEPLEKLRFY